MMTNSIRTAVICLCLLLGVSFTVFAEDAPVKSHRPDKTAALIDLLLKKGIITPEEAGAFKAEFIDAPASGDAAPGGAAREPKEEFTGKEPDADSEQIRQEVRHVEEKVDTMTDLLLQRDRLAERHREDIEQKVDNTVMDRLYKSSWAQKIKMDGDVRLRYQGEFFDDENGDFLEPDDPTKLMNSKTDRHRFRYRARLNIKAGLIDNRNLNVGKVEAGFRVSTGNGDNPISTNDTFGDYLNKDGIVLDRAYLKWSYTPELPVWGKIPGVTLWGGRMANPWFSTNLVWDSDLNFEGLAFRLESDTHDFSKWRSGLTLGIFPLQEEKFSQRDKWFYGAQLDLAVNPRYDVKTRWGIAYYDYRHVEGVVNDPLVPGENDFTAPLFQQKGNTLIDIDPSSDILTALASDYNLLNATAMVDVTTFFPIHAVFSAEVVANLGFDQDDVAVKTGIGDVPEDILGYQIKALVGYPVIREFGQWNTSLNYRYLESDAVIDAFTDSDFHNGGTNAKGWILGYELGIYKDMWVAFKWLTSDEIAGPPFAVEVMQLDLNARF